MEALTERIDKHKKNLSYYNQELEKLLGEEAARTIIRMVELRIAINYLESIKFKRRG